MVLLKIRKNYTYEDIGNRFQLSGTYVSRLCNKIFFPMADILISFIFWPNSQQIICSLPLAFRANYKKIQSIIDCFEIEIEQPSDPIFLSLTWSQYKQCITMKYLISSTPNGFINFVSAGYGGRTTDTEILKLCNYLNVVPEGQYGYFLLTNTFIIIVPLFYLTFMFRILDHV